MSPCPLNKRQVPETSYRFSRLTFIFLTLITVVESVLNTSRSLSTTTNSSINLFSSYIGTDSYEYGYAIIQNSEHNYIVTGTGNNYEAGYFSESTSGISSTTGEHDLLLFMLNSTGHLMHSKVIGNATLDDMGNAIIQNAHGNYMLAGTTYSYDLVEKDDDFDPFPFDDYLYFPPYNFYSDGLIIKLGTDFKMLWAITLGHNAVFEDFQSIIQSSDGNYFAAGSQNNQALVVKINDAGEVIWAVTLAILDEVKIYSIIEGPNNGCIIAGYADQFSDSVGRGILLTSLDGNGDVLWSITITNLINFFSGQAYSLIKSHEGTYILAGDTPVNYGEAFIIEVGANGNVIKAFTLGSIKSGKYESVRAIIKTKDGGYALVGDVWFLGVGSSDVFVVKLTQGLSNIEWIKTIGGPYTDAGTSIIESNDGGLVLTGHLYGHNGTQTLSNLFVAKLDAKGNMAPLSKFYLQDHSNDCILKNITPTVTELSVATQAITLVRREITDIIGIIDANFNVTLSTLPATTAAAPICLTNYSPKSTQTLKTNGGTKSKLNIATGKKSQSIFAIDKCIEKNKELCNKIASAKCEKDVLRSCKNNAPNFKSCITLFKPECIVQKTKHCQSNAKIDCLKTQFNEQKNHDRVLLT